MARLRRISEQMDSIIKEIGPKLISFSHLRNESKLIISELESRGEVENRS